MYKVAVLLCTFNGEKYLQDQINSIKSQLEVEVTIFAWDDGSTDQTIDILNNNNISWTKGEKKGPAIAFMDLLYKHSSKKYDYFCFSDQDDIWYPDKLIRAIRKINDEKLDGKYVVYGANQMFMFEEETLPNRPVYFSKPELNLPALLNNNKIAGCTLVFDSQFARFVTDAPHVKNSVLNMRMHDLWIVLIALTCGKLVFDMEPCMDYRIHQNNVVGQGKVTFCKKLKRKLLYKKDKSSRSMYTRELIRCFGADICEEYLPTLTLYAEYKQNIKNKISFIFNRKIITSTGENYFIFVIKILFNYI